MPVDGLAIVAETVSVGYDLRLTRDRTLRRTVAELVNRDLGNSKYWALKDVSFVVHPGETLGLIGRNGSGKSTLLLALAGIIRSDPGRINTFGYSPTLLTLTTGFEMDLTGRDNIFLQGAYFGFGRTKMDELADAIIDFSELGDFIDVPLRKYSGGMRIRLAFSVAAFIEPEILLIDEVFGVGDAGFIAKSRDKIRELIQRSHAIVVATHDMSFVREICTKALWLNEGHLAAFGDPNEVVDAYIAETRLAEGPVRSLE
jgi:ABC-type polysaccharide/polyol phosphate transport system ATPase subunit